ncbi:MAG TPA: RecX family transcriptional regulator [Gaiellales bacterium]
MTVPEPREAALRRAGLALARRARSEAELARSLGSVAPPEVVSGVLADLRALGYLDDAALARALAERRLASGWGALRVRADLERLEVAGEPARAGIELAEAGERESAAGLLAARRLEDDPRRAAALLARRGFGEETVESLVAPGFD